MSWGLRCFNPQTWDSECPCCGGELEVPVGGGQVDEWGIRCLTMGCDLSDEQREKIAEHVEWDIGEYARRRDDY